MQMASNWKNGKPILGCVDWGDVVAAGIAGAFVPGAYGQGKRLFNAALAIPTLRANAQSAAKAGSHANKHTQRLNERIDTALDAAVNIGYGAAVKQSAKAAVPPTRDCSCEK